MKIPSLIQSLVSQAGCQGAVADDRDDFGRIMIQAFGTGYPQTRGNGGAAVTGGKRIVRAFASSGKTGYAVMLSQRVKPIFSTGQQFMGIGLVPHIPDDFIFGRIKYIVQSNGQFYGAQAGCQMASAFGNHLNDNFSDFRSQSRQIRSGYFF